MCPKYSINSIYSLILLVSKKRVMEQMKSLKKILLAKVSQINLLQRVLKDKTFIIHQMKSLMIIWKDKTFNIHQMKSLMIILKDQTYQINQIKGLMRIVKDQTSHLNQIKSLKHLLKIQATQIVSILAVHQLENTSHLRFRMIAKRMIRNRRTIKMFQAFRKCYLNSELRNSKNRRNLNY